VTICDGCDGILGIGWYRKYRHYRHDRHGKAGKMKNIQISEELFLALMKYHLIGVEECLPEIQSGLESKLEAMVNRQLYTTYKIAPTEEEREKARKEYLDKRGMHRDFRW